MALSYILTFSQNCGYASGINSVTMAGGHHESESIANPKAQRIRKHSEP
jgi:hypothetical protein